jgi:hypothetical protein
MPEATESRTAVGVDRTRAGTGRTTLRILASATAAFQAERLRLQPRERSERRPASRC